MSLKCLSSYQSIPWLNTVVSVTVFFSTRQIVVGTYTHRYAHIRNIYHFDFNLWWQFTWIFYAVLFSLTWICFHAILLHLDEIVQYISWDELTLSFWCSQQLIQCELKPLRLTFYFTVLCYYTVVTVETAIIIIPRISIFFYLSYDLLILSIKKKKNGWYSF